MRYVYLEVDRIPSNMQEGVVYYNPSFELAALLCACGCGHKVTLLVPESHQLSNEDGYATIYPSIGVFDAACKSHYIITAGQVRMLPSFTGKQASAIMRAQIQEHAARDNKFEPWIIGFTDKFLNRLRRLLKGN